MLDTDSTSKVVAQDYWDGTVHYKPEIDRLIDMPSLRVEQLESHAMLLLGVRPDL